MCLGFTQNIHGNEGSCYPVELICVFLSSMAKSNKLPQALTMQKILNSRIKKLLVLVFSWLVDNKKNVQ